MDERGPLCRPVTCQAVYHDTDGTPCPHLLPHLPRHRASWLWSPGGSHGLSVVVMLEPVLGMGSLTPAALSGSQRPLLSPPGHAPDGSAPLRFQLCGCWHPRDILGLTLYHPAGRKVHSAQDSQAKSVPSVSTAQGPMFSPLSRRFSEPEGGFGVAAYPWGALHPKMGPWLPHLSRTTASKSRGSLDT